MAQQTAVEWLIETMLNSAGMEQPQIEKVFEQAKKMECIQIIDAFDDGQANHCPPVDFDNGKDYYTKTYGQ